MDRTCPRCQSPAQGRAHFCANCGLALVEGAGGRFAGPGAVRHPQPLSPPAGCQPIARSDGLHYRTDNAWGGTVLLGVEPLQLTVFNGGYDLKNATLRITGLTPNGRRMPPVAREITEWPRGAAVGVEVPSYDMPEPIQAIEVELVSAEFAWGS